MLNGAGSSGRAAIRLTALAAVTAAASVGVLAVRAFAPARPQAARRGLRWLTRCWARAAARILGMRVRVEGCLPEAPRLLVANHLSYVDVVALWCAVDGLFVAKSEVAAWPLVGRCGRLVRTLFLDRTRKRDLLRVLPLAQAALEDGETVILFAEGTSSAGCGVLPFKSSLFEAAARARVPVACASLGYATPAGAPSAHLAVCWWGDMTFPDHAWGLLGLPGFEVRVRFAEKLLLGPDRKWLARCARGLVDEGFVPVEGAA